MATDLQRETAPALAPTVGTPSRRRTGASRAVRIAGCSALGALACAGVVLAREHGQPSGVGALALAALAALALPTSPHLSGRVCLTGTALLGWSQLLWWTRLDFDPVGVLLGVLVGLAVGVVTAWWWGPRTGGWTPVPHVGPVDALPGLVLLVGLVSREGSLRHVGVQEALARLLPAWDNAGHFSMFASILEHGATTDALPAPRSGGHWQYAYYPQGFHATVATTAQLLWPRSTWTTHEALTAYLPASTLVVLLAVTVLTASLTSLPVLRARWEVALPLVGLIAGAYLWGLGQALVSWGFAGFVFTCTLAGSALLVGLMWQQVRQTAHLVALGGAAVGVAHGWILLMSLLVPVALGLLYPLSARRLVASPSRWVLAMLVALVTTLCVWHAVLIVTANPDGGLLATPGFIYPPSPWGLLALVSALSVVTLRGRVPEGDRVPDRDHEQAPVRARISALMFPVAGIVLCYLGVVQVHAHGEVGYYFWKYLSGTELVLVVLLVALVATRAAPVRSGPRPPRAGSLTRIGLLTVVTVIAGACMGTGSPGWTAAPHRASPTTWRALAAELVPAADNGSATAGPTMLMVSPGPLDTMNGAIWDLALRGSWTSAAEAQAEQLQGIHTSTTALVGLAKTWLAHDRGSLEVPPDVYRRLARDPAMDGQLDRVRAW